VKPDERSQKGGMNLALGIPMASLHHDKKNKLLSRNLIRENEREKETRQRKN